MHTSTPATTGPSTQTLDFIRNFARQYKPTGNIPKGRHRIISATNVMPLGEC